MVTANAMDHDDDVEHLFSWLQTPELRYREFAGAREITDTVVTWQARQNTANGEAPADQAPAHENVQLEEEQPVDRLPDRSEVEVEPPVSGPAMIAPVPMSAAERAYASDDSGPFVLGAAGRSALLRPQTEEPMVPPPIIQTPAPRLAAAPLPLAPPETPPRPAVSAPANGGGGLLGGAYRENGSNGHAADNAAAAPPPLSPDSQRRNEGSLDAVFGRLAGGRSPLPEPRERLRHIPGFGPPAGRPR